MPGPTTIDELLTQTCAAHADRRALVALDPAGAVSRTVTYAELADEIERATAGLAGLGLGRGDALAVWLPNGIEWVVLAFAANRLGALCVPLNTRYKANEALHLVRTGGARMLAYQPDFHGIDFDGMVAELGLLDQLITVGTARDGATTYDDLVDSNVVNPDQVTSDQVRTDQVRFDQEAAVVFGTSGTTSAPKLALHVQETVARHADQVARTLPLTPDDVVLGLLPPCGAYGYVVLTAALAGGATTVLLPAFDDDGLAAAIPAHDVTFFAVTEAIFRTLLTRDGFEPAQIASLNRAAVAGVSIADVTERAAEHGVTCFNVYGSSECLALLSFWDTALPQETRIQPGGVLVDERMNVRTQDGELQFQGASVMSGYLGNEEASAKAFTDDGWFRSQDRGRVLEDGRSFVYESRAADTLRLRGYLVNPAEIEELLLSHPAVAQAPVVGLPDKASGEDIAIAFVQLAAGATSTPGELAAHIKANAASYKVPKRIAIVDELPTTPSPNGAKVLKNRLREQAAQMEETT